MTLPFRSIGRILGWSLVVAAGGCGDKPTPPPTAGDVNRVLEAAVENQDAIAVAQFLGRTRPRDIDRLGMAAVERGNVSILRMLVASGFAVNYGVGGNTQSPLTAACRLGHTEVVRFLLGAGSDPNGATGPGGAYPPLFYAIQGGHVQAVGLLVAHGANPNARLRFDLRGQRIDDQSRGPTLLMVATAWGCPKMVSLLLESGADSSLTDWRGRTAVDWLGELGDPTSRIRAALQKVPKK